MNDQSLGYAAGYTHVERDDQGRILHARIAEFSLVSLPSNLGDWLTHSSEGKRIVLIPLLGRARVGVLDPPIIQAMDKEPLYWFDLRLGAAP